MFRFTAWTWLLGGLGVAVIPIPDAEFARIAKLLDESEPESRRLAATDPRHDAGGFGFRPQAQASAAQPARRASGDHH